MTGIEILMARLTSDAEFCASVRADPDQALAPYVSRLSNTDYDLVRRLSALISLPSPALLKDLLDPTGGGGTQGNWWSSTALPVSPAP